MCINPGLLQQMRDALNASLPEKAFLRRDRGDALFISNAPTFDPGMREIPGFTIEVREKLMHILPDAGWLARLEAAEPQDQLSRSLLRFRGQAPDHDNLRLFAQGLKLLDFPGSAPEAEIEAYDRALRQRAALALRGGCGGGLYAAALVNAQVQFIKGEKQI